MMLARLLSKIYKKNGIILIDSKGQKYICGQPDLKTPIRQRWHLVSTQENKQTNNFEQALIHYDQCLQIDPD